ncbi:MAG: TfoX/Sxy family protein [Clostridiales bacterium]|jgi:DNA transformation protein|nr:TfoX/Sxy family protein [Clostridiales bacterium]
MGELSNLPNIAEKLESQLYEAGITTVRQLKEIGSREAWLRILSFDPTACIMRLSALEGAIQGIRWHNLDDGIKESLKEFYHLHKAKRTKANK